MDSSSNSYLIDSWTQKNFKPLKTILISIGEFISLLILEILTIYLVINQNKTGIKCYNYILIIYTQCVHWFISFITHFILQNQHSKLRLNGYLSFYKATNQHFKLSFYLTSLWTSIILLINNTIFHFYFDELEKHCKSKDLYTPVNFLTPIVSLEVLVNLLILATYMKKVYKFNKSAPVPDVQREEWSYIPSQSTEVGHSIQQSGVEELLEKQADVIEYLKEHIEKMNQKILLLNAQLRACKNNKDSSTSTNIVSQ